MSIPERVRDKLKSKVNDSKSGDIAVFIARPGTKAGVIVGPFKSREACKEWLDTMAERYPNAMDEADINIADLAAPDALDRMLKEGEDMIRSLMLQ